MVCGPTALAGSARSCTSALDGTGAVESRELRVVEFSVLGTLAKIDVGIALTVVGVLLSALEDVPGWVARTVVEFNRVLLGAFRFADLIALADLRLERVLSGAFIGFPGLRCLPFDALFELEAVAIRRASL